LLLPAPKARLLAYWSAWGFLVLPYWRCDWSEGRDSLLFQIFLDSSSFQMNLFAWLISHPPAVLFSHNKSATSNQTAVLFSQNKPAPATSQTNRLCRTPNISTRPPSCTRFTAFLSVTECRAPTTSLATRHSFPRLN
jgi:hypothetical protein